MIEKTYNVGIYCRLSNDDERDGESVSIENHVFLHEGNNLLICNAALIEVRVTGNENSVLIRSHSAQLCICSESLRIIRTIERLRKDVNNSSV